MSDLTSLALQRIPSALRDDAAQVAEMLSAGYKLGEIAQYMEIPRQRVGELRDGIKEGMVAALRADGYTNPETIRYLGVPTAAVASLLARD